MKRVFSLLVHRWLPNLALSTGVFFLIRADLLVLAYLLFILSKWQVMLGGHRLWLFNIRDHACDIAVGLSAITVIYIAGPDLILQLVLTLLFSAWLLFIKPLGSVAGVGLQALICQFSGLAAFFLIGRDLPQVIAMIVSWLVSVIAMNHFIQIFQRPERLVMALIWGLLVAEICWLLWRWFINYSFLEERVLIPQIALIVSIVGYTVGSIYRDHAERSLRKIRLVEYVLVNAALLLIVIIGTDWVSQL